LEAKAIVAEQYQRAKEILQKNAEGHAQLSALLLEREVIFAEDLEAVFGKRPWSSRHDELILQNDDEILALEGATETSIPQSEDVAAAGSVSHKEGESPAQ